MRHPLAPLAAVPEVASAVARSRDAMDRLLTHRVLRRRSAEVSAEAALRCARASAALEGVDVALETLRATGGSSDEERGALRVSLEVGAAAALWGRTPPQALARLHVAAAAGRVPPSGLGRPVTADRRLGALTELVLVPGEVPALVEAAVVHGELLALAPFGWGSGLVARAAARVVLVARGLDPKGLTAPDVGHAELALEYAAAARGFASGGADGVVGWVVHCGAALELGARESLAVCESLLRSP